MRVRSLCTAFCLLITSAALAQSGSSGANLAAQPNPIRERLNNADCERMRWEAAQMWSLPMIPNENSESDNRPVHIEQVNQSLLSVPKLRREWLRPALDTESPKVAGDTGLSAPNPFPMPFARPSLKAQSDDKR